MYGLTLVAKKNILVFSDWYLPAYKAGGPVKSIASLVSYLKDDFNFFIVTGNKDLFSKEAHSTIKSNAWNTLQNGEQVYYFSDDKFSFKNLKTLLAEIKYDVVYLNSFFSTRFTIYPLLLKKLNAIKTPVLLAPRGMLGSGALSLKSGKKNIFIKLARLTGLYNKVFWHATSTQEENEIRHFFNESNIKIIANLSSLPIKDRINYSKKPAHLSMCFISRISKKKNLLYALEVLNNTYNGQIIFDVYGPAEDEAYLKICKENAKKFPSNITVNFKSELHPNEIETTLQQYHAFFLPTLNENFGHAIVEAMLNGCIPLISTETPWRNLQSQGIGWDIPLNEKEKFVEAIEELLKMSQEDFEQKSKALQKYARVNCIDASSVEKYKELFISLAQQ